MSPIVTTINAGIGRFGRSPTPPVEAVGSISIAADASAFSVQQSASVDVTLTLTRVDNTQTVTITPSGLASGITASYPDGQTFTGAATTRRVRLTAAIDAGTVTNDAFTLDVSTPNGASDSVALTLTITAPASGDFSVSLFDERSFGSSGTVYQDGERIVYVDIDRDTYEGGIEIAAVGLPTGVTASYPNGTTFANPTNGGTIEIDVDADNRDWQMFAARVPRGQWDRTRLGATDVAFDKNPIFQSTAAVQGPTTGGALTMPDLSANNAGSQVLAWFGATGAGIATPSGWTEELNNNDVAVRAQLFTRDAATTAGETISGVAFDKVSTNINMYGVGVVIPAATGQTVALQDFVYSRAVDVRRATINVPVAQHGDLIVFGMARQGSNWNNASDGIYTPEHEPILTGESIARSTIGYCMIWAYEHKAEARVKLTAASDAPTVSNDAWTLAATPAAGDVVNANGTVTVAEAVTPFLATSWDLAPIGSDVSAEYITDVVTWASSTSVRVTDASSVTDPGGVQPQGLDAAVDGTQFLRFRYPYSASSSATPLSEQRWYIDGDNSNDQGTGPWPNSGGQTEQWLEYYVFLPDNYHNRTDGGTNSRKFLALWNTNYNPEAGRCLLVLELRPDGWEGNSAQHHRLRLLAVRSDLDALGETTNYQNAAGVSASCPMRYGQWTRVRIYTRLASTDTANDGAFVMWLGDTLAFALNHLNLWPQGITTAQLGDYPGWRSGYFMGEGTSGFREEQGLGDDAVKVGVDKVRLWHTDPEWGGLYDG